jgi:hypothetical protein
MKNELYTRQSSAHVPIGRLIKIPSLLANGVCVKFRKTLFHHVNDNVFLFEQSIWHAV